MIEDLGDPQEFIERDIDFDEKLIEKLSPLPPKGPLDIYRTKATFDWRMFRIKFHGEDILDLKMKIWKHLQEKIPYLPINLRRLWTQKGPQLLKKFKD